ncbi:MULTISPECIES: Clp protease N-terminal domain-containing protein [Streptomyces]|uniref:Clp protease n=1 Tax=Streptomyces lycii TaxID=2654337 RepID=A0ABQ7FCX2_9ACTN|nr:Clp protease N-terminal domain-containing protein [Streptomyces lycii]KAF4406427.1 Clp protease [Streptomyces lycii]
MFERFTRQARGVVVGAQEESRKLGHREIGSEHLLLALLAGDEQDEAAAALRRASVTAGDCRAAVAAVAGPGGDGLGEDDAEALRALGIDLDRIRGRAEERFGPGALDRAPRPGGRGPWRLSRFRRRGRPGGERGHIPFAPRAKKALERSLREALALGDREIGSRHVLLGLLTDEDKVVTGVLRRLGTDPGSVRAELRAGRGRAA